MDVTEDTNLSRAKYIFFSLLEIRWDSTRGRTGSRIYPSRGMIYHRDVPLKSFLSETCSLQNRVTAPSLPPSLLSPLRVSVQFSFRCKRFGARSTVEMNSEWVMDTGARLMEGSVSVDLNIDTSARCLPILEFLFLWNFIFFFIFNFFSGIRAWSDDTVVVTRHVPCANIYRVRVLLLFYFLFFFLEISCKYF